MAEQNTMAHQRPPFAQRHSGSGNAFSPPFSQPPPSNHMNFPSPAQQSPSMPYSQLPANKRPRLSPSAPSPYGSPSFSVMSDMRADGPANAASVNGMMPAPAPPGSMGPPSRPVEKATDIRSLEDTLSGTGVNIDEEERNLTATSFSSFGQRTPSSTFHTHDASFGPNSENSSFE